MIAPLSNTNKKQLYILHIYEIINLLRFESEVYIFERKKKDTDKTNIINVNYDAGLFAAPGHYLCGR